MTNLVRYVQEIALKINNLKFPLGKNLVFFLLFFHALGSVVDLEKRLVRVLKLFQAAVARKKHLALDPALGRDQVPAFGKFTINLKRLRVKLRL